MADKVDAEVIRMAELFGEIARALAAHGNLEKTTQHVVELATENLRACEDAGISWVDGRKIESSAATGERPRRVDEIQSEVNEGPSLDAMRHHEVLATGDLTTETRWPKFAERAYEETGLRSILAFRLFIQEDTIGALNLYSSHANAFNDDVDVALGAVFAAHASVAISASQREDELERKAASRDLIGRAKGILMARSQISDEEAFELLRRASQRMNIKLREVAERIVHTPPGDRPE